MRMPTRCHSLPRFLFILLGPAGKAKSYNEIGRAIATLMVDDVSKCQTRPCWKPLLLRAGRKTLFASYCSNEQTLNTHK